MLVFASAERSLLANRQKYSSGSTEAIALTTPFSAGGLDSAGLPLLANVATLATNAPFANDLGYFVTTGNGTWSQTAPNWQYAQSNLGPYTTNANNGQYVPSSITFGIMADHLFQGLQAVTFPSKMLGVAVGQNIAGVSAIIGATSPYTSGPQLATAVTPPNILMTTDVATTWMAPTFFGPTPAGSCTTATAGQSGCSAATMTSFPSALTFVSMTLAVTAGAAAPQTVALLATGTGTPITSRTPFFLGPDLSAVTCTSRVLCFAVGGYALGTLNPTGTTVTRPTGYTYGQILTSTNGGTAWNYVNLPANIPSSFCTSAGITSAQQCPVPGLTGIAADSSGRHMYAVGWTPLAGQVTVGDATTAGNIAIVTPVSTTSPYAAPGAGFIMYSGNSGASWVIQSAPVLANLVYVYTSVAVLRGTIAVAAGGQPTFSQVYVGGILIGTPTTLQAGQGQAGVVSATFNGGFSWLNMPITANFINGIACQSSNPQKTYSCIVVSDRYQAQRTTFNATTVSNVLLGTQVAPNLQPAFTWTAVALPSVGTVSLTSGGTFPSTASATSQIGAHLLGVVFDNPQVGWIFGYSTILRTSNGGTTWFSETPFQIAAQPTGAGGQAVFGLVPVPTSY